MPTLHRASSGEVVNAGELCGKVVRVEVVLVCVISTFLLKHTDLGWQVPRALLFVRSTTCLPAKQGAGAPWPEAVTSAVAVGSPLPSAAPSLSASLPCALRPRACYPARGPGPSSRVSPAWLCPTIAAAAHLISLPSTSPHNIQTVCASSPSTYCAGYSLTCLLPPPAVLWGAASPRAVAWRELSQVTCMLSHFSHVQLLVGPWTVAHQAPLSMRFSRQGYWSGLPCPSYKLPQNRGTQTRWFLRFLPNLRF